MLLLLFTKAFGWPIRGELVYQRMMIRTKQYQILVCIQFGRGKTFNPTRPPFLSRVYMALLTKDSLLGIWP
jgi:hypothetical protein